MTELIALIEANWLPFGAALLVVILIGWWLLRRASSVPERHHAPDVLDEGQAPAARNQALIDAPPAALIVPPAFGGAMGGLAEAIAVGAQDVVEEAEARVVAPPPPSPPPPVEVPEPAPKPEPTREVAPALVAAPSPPPEPTPEPPATAAPSGADDLARIKGLGPKLQALLPTLGITTFAQIAALTEADLAELDGKLGAFAGRPARDGWVEQAGYLAAGDVAGFEARFGKV